MSNQSCPLLVFFAGLRPVAQALGEIGSIVGAARYAHSRFNPRMYHSIRTTGPMPLRRRRRVRYGRRRGRPNFRKSTFRRRRKTSVPRLRRKRRAYRRRPARLIGHEMEEVTLLRPKSNQITLCRAFY